MHTFALNLPTCSILIQLSEHLDRTASLAEEVDLLRLADAKKSKTIEQLERTVRAMSATLSASLLINIVPRLN